MWYEIARAKNAAANGRLFNALMFALVLFIAFRIDTAALWLAFFPPLSIGVGYLADTFGQRVMLSYVSIAAAVIPLLSIFYI
jgi:hypothetical protein